MWTSTWSAAVVVTMLFAASSAHADDEKQTARVHFTSDKDAAAIREAACAMRAVGPIGGRARLIDVEVDDERCSSLPREDDSLAVRVSVTSNEDINDVVLEANVQSDIPLAQLSVAVEQTGRALKARLERPAPRSHHARSSAMTNVDTDTVMANPTLRGFGIASLAIGGVGLATGALIGLGVLLVSGLESADCGIEHTLGGPGCSANISTPVVLALSALGAGAAFMIAGGVMMDVGGKRVPRVAAFVAPMGASLRVTF